MSLPFLALGCFVVRVQMVVAQVSLVARYVHHWLVNILAIQRASLGR